MNKKYKVGFFGGKFMPLHKGHYHVLEKAAAECEKVYFVMYAGGEEERKAADSDPYGAYLLPEERFNRVIAAASDFDNVIPVYFDVSDYMLPDGSEDWNAEVDQVYCFTGPYLDAIYGSEPAYSAYYRENFPGAVYVIVDPDRHDVNISATAIRNMTPEQREKWLV